MLATTAIILLIVYQIQPIRALYVANGSPCSPACNGTSGTYYPNLVCSTDDFESNSKGQLLKSCLECMIDSTYINSSYTDGNTDEYWALFHMKYVQQYCLIDQVTPHIAAVNACSSTCSPLSPVLETLWINKHPFLGQYNYCTANSSIYTQYAGPCATCLQSQAESVIIGNFVDTMNQACSSRPYVANGNLINPTRSIFDTVVAVSSTIGSATATGRNTATNTGAASASTTASTTTSTSARPSTTAASDTGTVSKSDNGLGTGAIAGIAVAATIVGIALMAGLVFLLWRRRRSRKLQPANSKHASTPNSGDAYGHDVKYGPIAIEKPADGYIAEKPANEYATRLHEAPVNTERRFVELPASSKP